MATVRLGTAFPVNMGAVNTVYGLNRIATSTQVENVAEDNYGNVYVFDYFGQGFTYGPGLNAITGGTLTGFSETADGITVATATGFSVPASAASYLVNVNNWAQLEALTLTGNDTIYGAGNGDGLMGFGGNNTLVGVASGNDYAEYLGSSGAYTITANSAGYVVNRPDGGYDQLINIKAAIFTDRIVPLVPAPTPTPNSEFAVISPQTIGIYRMVDTNNGHHFYTAGTAEEQQATATYPNMKLEGIDFNAVMPGDGDLNAVPVYRFTDVKDGVRFYTASLDEVRNTQMTIADFHLDGVAFYEHMTPQAGDAPIYRFRDVTNDTHFYTGGAAEVAHIQATMPQMKLEGVAFYAPTH